MAKTKSAEIKSGKQSIKETQKNLRQKAKELAAENRARLREFRHSVANLKKAGIVSARTDARSVKPSRHFKKLIRENLDIASGQAHAVRAPKSLSEEDAIRLLEEQGYRVIPPKRGKKARIVLPREETIKRGKIYRKPRGNRPGYFLDTHRLHAAGLEDELDELYDDIDDGDLIGFSIAGNTSFQLYPNAFALSEALKSYTGFKRGGTSREEFLSIITTFRVDRQDRDAYMAESRARQKQARLAKARAKREATKQLGLRVVKPRKPRAKTLPRNVAAELKR